jgi:hypothetical protein
MLSSTLLACAGSPFRASAIIALMAARSDDESDGAAASAGVESEESALSFAALLGAFSF